MLGFNINNIRTYKEHTIYDDLTDVTTVHTEEEKKQSMGPYVKLKLAFYLGRHFWSH